jgi:adenylate cyclase
MTKGRQWNRDHRLAHESGSPPLSGVPFVMPGRPLWRRWRLFVCGALLGALSSGLVLIWRYANAPFSRLLVTLELQTYDYRADRRARLLGEQRDNPTVIVDIDEFSIGSLAEEGRPWPWPRDVHAQLVRKLTEAGAKVIGFDVNFDTVTPAPGQQRDPDDYFWEPEPCASDKALAKAIGEAGNVVLAIVTEEKVVENLGQQEVLENASFPHPIFEDAAAGTGDVEIPLDLDGTARRGTLQTAFRDETLPSFSVAVAAVYLGREVSAYLDECLGRYRDVLQPDGSFWIDFHHFPGSTTSIPFVEAYKGTFDDDQVKGKIVLVGASAPDLQDLWQCPVTRETQAGVGRALMPGVEIHANAIRTLLADRYLRVVPVWATVLATLLLGCLTGILTLHLRPTRALAFYVPIAVVGLVWIAFWLFAVRDLWANLVLPLLGGVGASYLVTTVFAYFTVERQRKQIEAAWSKRVSREVLEKILANPSLAHVEGRTVEATVMFTDLRGSTGLAHSMRPEAFVGRLNDIFACMTPIIMEHGGNIDKFIGDGIMAIFGDPVPQENHARHAVLAAREMMQAMDDLQGKAQARGERRIDMGIGIHTGELVAGDIGSGDRLEYTVIGDTVNTASRMEGLNKEYGTSILITGDTRALVGDDVEMRLVDTTRVRGRDTPVQVYEVPWRS